jgi:hypothetical protein
MRVSAALNELWNKLFEKKISANSIKAGRNNI